MVCSSVVFALVMWTAVQFGSQSVMMAAIEMSNGVKVPIMSVQNLIERYSDLPISGYRYKRTARKIPSIDNKELKSTVRFAQTQVEKMARHELNIEASGVKVEAGTPGYGLYLESYPSQTAFHIHRDAIIALKASQYLRSKHCIRLGIDDIECMRQVNTVPMSPSYLGSRCFHANSNFTGCKHFTEYRSFDGACIHPVHPAWGRSFTAYERILLPDYENGIEQARGMHFGGKFVSPRIISTTLATNLDKPDTSKTLIVMQWGEFIAHDMIHTAVSRMLTSGATISCCNKNGKNLSPRHLHPSCLPIEIPTDDPFYSEFHQTCMSYVRSMAAIRPDCKFGHLEQMNQATHYLDGSMIYGTTQEIADSLRSFSGGRLRTKQVNGKDFLPETNDQELCIKNASCYQAGDIRANLHPSLAAMHTLWVREHNRLAERMVVLNSHWNDERVFKETRKIVIAQIQHITYNEWLPIVLGMNFVRRHSGLVPETGLFSKRYNEKVNPSVSNSFATAAMKAINSMVEGRLGLYKEDRSADKTILLKDYYYKPDFIEPEGNLDSFIRGMTTQSCQRSDLSYSDAVTNYMYNNDQGSYGMDEFSLNIQRGRDHGLPGYNRFRKYCGLKYAKSFDDLVDYIPRDVIIRLRGLYRDVDEIDLLVGGLAENTDDGVVGPTLRCILAEQFQRTRSGDKHFYDNGGLPSSFTPDQLREISKTTLARVLCDNGDDIKNMQPFVFHKPASPQNDLVPCGADTVIGIMDLEPWREEPKSI